ncbi:Ribosomal protein S35, mitochondrial [Ceraceosorus bombacis]|uniref:Ribosomal protein S35, mitochondrial n=1 Tax=Ceraceosorus bombacis TaxID=401625 RepID=A0A0P1BJX6_9BASI|nr:Ribosomal protein S35, mitochondrial [Ceraceosorus bombacis]
MSTSFNMASFQRTLATVAAAGTRTTPCVPLKECTALSRRALHTSEASRAQQASPSTSSPSGQRSSSFAQRDAHGGAARARSAGGPSSGAYSSNRTFPSSNRSGPGRRFGPGGANGRFSGGAGGRARDSRKPRAPRRLPPYEEWLKSEDAKKWRQPPSDTRGPFWISDTPFPLNKTFNPSPPIASHIRDEMWAQHQASPRDTGSAREISSRFGVSIERVEAVLRLCALEREFTAHGQPLQTHFAASMEQILGSAAKPAKLRLQERAAAAESGEGSDASQLEFRSPVLSPLYKAQSNKGGADGRRLEPNQAIDEDVPVDSNPNSNAVLEIRGPYREMVDEGTDPPEVLRPALEAATQERQAQISALPSSKPEYIRDRETGELQQVSSVPLSLDEQRAFKGRSLKVVNVGSKSYRGAGTVERNRRRAERRSRLRAVLRLKRARKMDKAEMRRVERAMFLAERKFSGQKDSEQAGSHEEGDRGTVGQA